MVAMSSRSPGFGIASRERKSSFGFLKALLIIVPGLLLFQAVYMFNDKETTTSGKGTLIKSSPNNSIAQPSLPGVPQATQSDDSDDTNKQSADGGKLQKEQNDDETPQKQESDDETPQKQEKNETEAVASVPENKPTIIEKRLEFVHITKTGGSAVEKVGAGEGIIWGACHYMNLTEVGCGKADIEYIAPNYQSYALTSPWHTPPKLLKKYVEAAQYPYTDAELFVVIRNPYDRIISEYYCPWLGFQAKYRKNVKKDKDPNDPVNLNWWVQNMVSTLKNATEEFEMKNKDGVMKLEQSKGVNEDKYILAQKHYVNQAEYVFDGDEVIVQHLVHYEDLGKEFDALMTKFGIDATMPSKEKSGVYTNSEKKLSYKDLDSKSIKMINDFAKPDFEKFGYKMVDDKFQDDYSLKSTFKSEL